MLPIEKIPIQKRNYVINMTKKWLYYNLYLYFQCFNSTNSSFEIYCRIWVNSVLNPEYYYHASLKHC